MPKRVGILVKEGELPRVAIGRSPKLSRWLKDRDLKVVNQGTWDGTLTEFPELEIPTLVHCPPDLDPRIRKELAHECRLKGHVLFQNDQLIEPDEGRDIELLIARVASAFNVLAEQTAEKKQKKKQAREHKKTARASAAKSKKSVLPQKKRLQVLLIREKLKDVMDTPNHILRNLFEESDIELIEARWSGVEESFPRRFIGEPPMLVYMSGDTSPKLGIKGLAALCDRYEYVLFAGDLLRDGEGKTQSTEDLLEATKMMLLQLR